MKLVVLTGASGSGKTTLARAAGMRLGGQIEVCFFDSIAVPPMEQMVAEYGSGEAWQRAKTIAWMRKIAPIVHSGRRVLLEGQSRFSFLEEAVAAAGINDCRMILLDCDDAARVHRLTVERRQPDLASEEMMSWARHLRAEAERGGYEILDTTDTPLETCVDQICRLFRAPGCQEGPHQAGKDV
jgi:RNase adaptor protein for sRNA GlmZ degradation